jgi:hypothetical protein
MVLIHHPAGSMTLSVAGMASGQTATYDIPLMSVRRLNSRSDRPSLCTKADIAKRTGRGGGEIGGTQVGGLSSPASQPSALEVMGSLGMTVVLVRPHCWHSKVWLAEPQGCDPSLDNSMRCCGQFGQCGRLIAEICAVDTGLNSGMMHRAGLDCGRIRPPNRSAPCPFRLQKPWSNLHKFKNFVREG